MWKEGLRTLISRTTFSDFWAVSPLFVENCGEADPIRQISMMINEFRSFLKKIPLLSERQREECFRQLGKAASRGGTHCVPDSISGTVLVCCPHCQHDKLWKWGYASGLQRWRCRDCGKTFNALTRTRLARLRKKRRWIDNARAMIAGESVRETARKCEVHRNTVFRWRHRFLEFHRKAQSKDLSGVAESDATYFRHSEKGSKTLQRRSRKRGIDRIGRHWNSNLVSVITLRSRSGKGADRVTTGKQRELAELLYRNHLAQDALLLTDGSHSLCAAARARNPYGHMALPGIKSRGIFDSPFHLQTNNAFHSHFKGWMARFRGVATKYLANYVGWHRHFFEKTHENRPDVFIALSFNPLSIHQQLTMT